MECRHKSTRLFRHAVTAFALLYSTLHTPHSALAAPPSHCLSLFGECKYPKGFTHFDYVNPDAPKRGEVKLAEMGSFDTVHPFILNGVKGPGIGLPFESLMSGSLDEPQAYYGLLAESATLADDHASVEFTLRKEARWHDGTPVTPDDVVFSFEMLTTKGDPTYKIIYAAVAGAEKTGPRSVRFTFKDPKNRELPLIAGQIPVFSKAYYTKHDFTKATLEPPMGSGPYKIASVDPGRSLIFERVKEYWGENLPVNKGQNNFDRIRYDLYRDENVSLEGLKAGQYDFRQEYIARNWATAYDSPALKDGRLIKREVPDAKPQGMQAFVFNTRQPKFQDRRVREAINLTLDYEWINKTLFYGAYKRNTSYFQQTEFAATGIPEGKELTLLTPFKDKLPPALFTEPFTVPKTDGSGNNRENLLKADRLLAEAGWTVKDGKRVNANGEPLKIEFMLRQPTMERVVGAMRRQLDRLGIATTIRNVDDAQYQKRTDAYDFDIVSIWINRGLFFPGNEQAALWRSTEADIRGGNNLAGVKDPVVDALVDRVLAATTKEELIAAGRALDRVLLWNHYVIPNWHSGSFRLAYWNKFGIPKVAPLYNNGLMTWWVK